MLHKKVPHFMTLHLRRFMRGPGNYPAARMIKKKNMATQSQDREGRHRGGWATAIAPSKSWPGTDSCEGHLLLLLCASGHDGQ